MRPIRKRRPIVSNLLCGDHDRVIETNEIEGKGGLIALAPLTAAEYRFRELSIGRLAIERCREGCTRLPTRRLSVSEHFDDVTRRQRLAPVLHQAVVEARHEMSVGLLIRGVAV